MAQDINKFIVIGRLTKDLGSDPNGRDFGYLQNGTCKGVISIANNRTRKNGDEWIEETSYFNITIWGKMAENLKPYLIKGKQVCCECFLKQDSWKDNEGHNRSQINIIADTVQLLGDKNSGNNNNQSFNPNTVYQSAQEAQQASVYAQQYAQQNQNVNNQPTIQQGGFQEDLPYADERNIPF